MITYFLFGFLIPWLIFLCFFRKAGRIAVVIAPFGMVVGFFINEFGFTFFWELQPVYHNVTLSALPMNLGLYAVLSCLFAFFLHKGKIRCFQLILQFSLLTTFLEWITLITGMSHYFNGWNLFWTFVSYVIAYVLVFIYYKLVIKTFGKALFNPS